MVEALFPVPLILAAEVVVESVTVTKGNMNFVVVGFFVLPENGAAAVVVVFSKVVVLVIVEVDEEVVEVVVVVAGIAVVKR